MKRTAISLLPLPTRTTAARESRPPSDGSPSSSSFPSAHRRATSKGKKKDKVRKKLQSFFFFTRSEAVFSVSPSSSSVGLTRITRFGRARFSSRGNYEEESGGDAKAPPLDPSAARTRRRPSNASLPATNHLRVGPSFAFSGDRKIEQRNTEAGKTE